MAITKITGASITADSIDGTKIADDAINSEHLTDGGIDDVHIGDVAATKLTGTIASGRLSAANLGSGTVPTARLGSGTANNGVFLRGDNTWATAGSTSASDLTSGTLPIARIADDAVTAAKLANSINTDIATGVTGNTTANAALPKAGGAMTGTITGFTSTGIDDNADATAITINTSEQVGIGTGSPLAKLHLTGSGNYNHTPGQNTTSDFIITSSEMSDNNAHSIMQLVSVRQSLGTGNGSTGYLGFSTIDDSNGQGIRDAGRIAIVNEVGGSRNSATALSFWTNAGGTDTTAATEKLRIKSNGNVGIGTVSPAGKLHIDTDATASLASATINEVSDFSAGSRVGFSGLPNNNDGMYFGMGVDGGISAGMGFFREASGWNSALTFYTNNQTSGAYGVDAIQERMRITSAGNVEIKNGGDLKLFNSGNTVSSSIWVDSNETGMGTSTSNYIWVNALNIDQQKCGYDRGWSDYPSITVRNDTTEGTQSEYRIHGMNGISGADFSVVFRSDGGYATGSDSRRKTNITEITGAIDKVKQLSGKSFNMINKEGDIQDNLSSESTGKKYGFIAQDAIDVIPEAVIFHEDENTPLESGWASAYAIDYSTVIPLLTNAIKEQQVMIDDLIARITTLEA